MKDANPTKIDLTSLGIVVAYASIIVVLVYTHTWEFQTSKESLTWEQPIQLSTEPLISPENYDIKFDSIEKSLSKVQFNPDGSMVFNTNTAHALEAAFSHIADGISDQDLARIKMLISRIHPQYHTAQLADLTVNYRNYILAKFEFDKKLSRKKSLEEAERALEYDIKLKQKYLGQDVADALFGNKHAMTRYLIERRKVLADDSLSQNQKQAKLIKLKAALKRLES